jgi:hypothetical protein
MFVVYGKYHDVTAKDFLKAQTDTEFRKTWDNTAINLTVLEQDSASNSDIVYWEMKWPVRVRLLRHCHQTAWVVNCTIKLMSTKLLGKMLHISCQKW